jgi:hypothetical protein
MGAVAHSFVRDGKRYFVPPTALGFDDFAGRGILLSRYHKEIFTHWTPPTYMYQFCSGGHAKMLRYHIGNSYFAHIDLRDFFEHISDTKIYRALRRIGLPHSKSYSLAGESTIIQGGRHVLPRGFHQSSLLAALVLDQSLVGSSIRRGVFSSAVTCYCDDIVISSKDYNKLFHDFIAVRSLIERTNFSINKEKSLPPNTYTICFNIILSNNELAFTDSRLAQFVITGQKYQEWCKNRRHNFEELYMKLIGRYVASINAEQEAKLRCILEMRPAKTVLR